MGKKELKRLLKLCESDLNSMADEAIFYKGRALKAEAMVERLIRVILSAFDWATKYDMLNKLIVEWRANPPKDHWEVK